MSETLLKGAGQNTHPAYNIILGRDGTMTQTVTNTIERPAALRQRIRELIEGALGDRLDAAYLFGSRARGDATADSDWDVLVMVHESGWDGAHEALRGLRGRLLEETDEEVNIFTLRWSDAREHGGLLRNVAREGQLL